MWNLNGNDQSQPDWRALANDLERRVDLLTGSLDEIRDVVRRLAAEAAQSDSVDATPTAGTTAVAVEDPPAAQAPEYEALPAADEVWSRSEWRAAPADGSPSAAEAAWKRDSHDGWPASMTAEIEAPAAVEEPEEAEAPFTREDEEREQVRRAVEQLRAELHGTAYEAEESAEPAPELVLQTTALEDMDPVREEVRRAVEAARAEIDSVRSHGDLVRSESIASTATELWPSRTAQETPKAREVAEMPVAPILPPTESRFDDKSLTASTIVIEDTDGRVELVRVYDALSRIECADQALLLNYTPHSVTVGLGMMPLPDLEALKTAVSQVFERRCEVALEGARASVTLTDGHFRAA